MSKKKTNTLKNYFDQIKKTILFVFNYAKLKFLSLTKYLIDLFLALTLILSLVYLAARSPEIHSYLIRERVGSKTYMIRGGPKTGGGTGFAIKAKSGMTYIVSNAHVCELSIDKYHVLVSNDEGRTIWRRILEISDSSDLCLIEGLPGVEGLTLGSNPSIGQIVAVVGHPSLMPITLSRGEIITTDDIEIFKGIIIDEKDPNSASVERWVDEAYRLTPEQCSLPKNKIVQTVLNFFFVVLEVKVCLDVTKEAYRTNVLIQPGNSGSPVVNFWGNVIGVVFASDRYNWGIAVSFKDLQKLLSNY